MIDGVYLFQSEVELDTHLRKHSAFTRRQALSAPEFEIFAHNNKSFAVTRFQLRAQAAINCTWQKREF